MSSFEDLFVATLLEFLEAAVHTAVKARNIYPAEAFERAKVYGITVRRARHPGICAYISNTVSRLKPLLQSSSLREVAIVFFSPQGQPLERVTLDLQVLHPLGSRSAQQQPVLDPAGLESSLSGVLLKLQFIDNLLRPLPQGCTFEVVAYTAGRDGVDMTYFAEDSAHTVELCQPVAGTPLKSVSVPNCLQLQVLLEESASKQ